jgi:hypothetical protein
VTPIAMHQPLYRSLHVVETVPTDYGEDIFAHYPGLKLGLKESVDFYGARLSRVAEEVMTQAGPADWVITGPAYHVLPGGPNLLSSYIYQDLQNKLPESIALSQVVIPDETADREIKDWDALNKYHNYSTFSQQERGELYRQSPEPALEPSDFRGRSILFVNDIRVTGTHERYLQSAFEKMDPPQVCWLYVLTVNPELAAAQPEIEYAINHSRIADFEEFAELIATRELEYTSRCITRLLSYEIPELESLVGRLDAGRKKAILDLALGEGRFSGEYFSEKIALLRSSIG